jgi:hypothetical protein
MSRLPATTDLSIVADEGITWLRTMRAVIRLHQSEAVQ